MLKVSQLLITGLGIIVAHGTQAECIFPEEIVIPDGALSNYEEMRDTETLVKGYMAEMETYLDCVEAEDRAQASEDQRSEDRTYSEELLHEQRRHTAIDMKHSVAEEFNEQLRVFLKANP